MAGKARTRDAVAFEAKLLDDVNLRLLKELQQDGRLGMAELGRRVPCRRRPWPSASNGSSGPG